MIPALRPGYLLSQLVEHHGRFVPGALLTGTLVELLGPFAGAGALPLVPLFALGSWMIVGAAARANGVTYRDEWVVSRTRAVDYVLSLLGLWTAVVLFAMTMGIPISVGRAAGGDLPRMQSLVGLALATVVSLALLTRLWPFYANRFLYRGRRTRRGRFELWVGPGLVTAWRMTARKGAFRRCTLPVLGLGLGLVGGIAALQLALDEGLPALVLAVLQWFVAVPYVTLVAVDRAAMLRLESEPWID
jgi:uncharacterized membrane protein (GlpM family)